MINSICVCGAGTMGSGIARVAAGGDFQTILFDLDSAVLQRAKDSIEKNLRSQVEKNKIGPDEKSQILGRLKYTSQINDCQADLIIEAIVEKMEAKMDLFKQLSAINPRTGIFASNTSSLSINAMAMNIPNPERFIGMHFFNPAPLMKLVEVVTTPLLSETVLQSILQIAKKMGKIPVTCKDAPGFIVNHVARPYYLEALRLVEKEGVGFESIDTLMESSGFKMGPFKLMDLIGNDINFAVSGSVYESLGKPSRLKPSALQESKVKSGELGKKSGKGYYEYPADSSSR